jgi:hypothetical protein
MNNTTTRRNLLRFGTTAAAYAAGASIVTGGIAIASEAKGAAPGSVSPGLAHAIEAVATAEQASARYQETVYEPVRRRYLAAREAVPHTVLAPTPGSGVSPSFWATDSREGMAVAKAITNTYPRTSTRPDVVQARRLLAADHRRSRRIQAKSKTTGFAECFDETNRLCEAVVDAENAVSAYPAASLADIEAKMAFIVKRDMEPNGGMMEHMLADARRLLGKGAR